MRLTLFYMVSVESRFGGRQQSALLSTISTGIGLHRTRPGATPQQYYNRISTALVQADIKVYFLIPRICPLLYTRRTS